MKGELVKVITEDGIELVGFFSEQRSDLAVLHTHGTAGDFYTHKFIETEVDVLSTKNISFLSANNRGHDVYASVRKHTKDGVGWAGKGVGGAFETLNDSYKDIVAWIVFLKKRGVKKIILQGHSLGPVKNILYANKNNENIVGLVHLSPQNDAGLTKFTFGEEKYKQIKYQIKKAIAEGRGEELIPSELALICPMSYQTFSEYFLDDGIGNLFSYEDPDNKNWWTLSSINLPQLLVFGENDGYIKPSVQTAEKVFREKVANKSLLTSKIITNANHSFVGYEKKLTDEILNWLKKYYS